MRAVAILTGLFALAFAAPAVAQTEIAYGEAPLQKLDIYPAKAGGSAPLIVFVHGGSWSKGDKGNPTGAAKIEHFTARGFAVASLNYRLVPEARAEDQAQDVADALRAEHACIPDPPHRSRGCAAPVCRGRGRPRSGREQRCVSCRDRVRRSARRVAVLTASIEAGSKRTENKCGLNWKHACLRPKSGGFSHEIPISPVVSPYTCVKQAA